MSVAVATMGKFLPQAGYGLGWNTVKGIGGEGGGEYVQKKPVVEMSYRSKKRKKIEVKLSLRGENEDI